MKARLAEDGERTGGDEGVDPTRRGDFTVSDHGRRARSRGPGRQEAVGLCGLRQGLRGGAPSLSELANLGEKVVLVASTGETSEVRGS